MFSLPDWTFEFHGHRCPFMPIGYRMGSLMLKSLGVPKAQDHDYFMFAELGVGHPQTCMIDGLQASTGCTYGKLMVDRLRSRQVKVIIGVVLLAIAANMVRGLL